MIIRSVRSKTVHAHFNENLVVEVIITTDQNIYIYLGTCIEFQYIQMLCERFHCNTIYKMRYTHLEIIMYLIVPAFAPSLRLFRINL